MKYSRLLRAFGLLLVIVSLPGCGSKGSNQRTMTGTPIRIGQRDFAEGRILAQIVGFLAQDAGEKPDFSAEYIRSLDAWRALVDDELDVVVDYVGTIASEYLTSEITSEFPQLNDGKSLGDIRAEDLSGAIKTALDEKGLAMSKSLRFDNAYHLCMLESVAAEKEIKNIDDLKKHQDLKYAVTESFFHRKLDGWGTLSKKLGLKATPEQESHAECYRLLFKGDIQVTTAYTTDPENPGTGDKRLRPLKGELFPSYDVVLLYRKDLSEEVRESILRLENKIKTPEEMTNLIKRTINKKRPEGVELESVERIVAGEFVARKFDTDWGRRRLQLIIGLLVCVAVVALVWLARAYRNRSADDSDDETAFAI